MKKIFVNNQLSKKYTSEIVADLNFQVPNLILPMMKRAIHPEAEILLAITHLVEEDRFFLHNILYETIKSQREHVNGFVVDEVFTEGYNAVDTQLLHELNLLVKDKHLLVGPSFTKVPPFLHSKIINELIDYNVSGVLYDLREADISDDETLRPLAKLKAYVRNRLEIIPLFAKESDAHLLDEKIKFKVVAIETQIEG